MNDRDQIGRAEARQFLVGQSMVERWQTNTLGCYRRGLGPSDDDILVSGVGPV